MYEKEMSWADSKDARDSKCLNTLEKAHINQCKDMKDDRDGIKVSKTERQSVFKTKNLHVH